MPFETPLPLEDIIDPLAVYRAGDAMAEIGGNALWEAVRERTPVAKDLDPESDRKPGTARDSIMRTPVRGHRGLYGGWEVLVFTEDPVFPFIEWDTRPHLILPRLKHALRFPMNGSTVFAASVNHPGTTGQHPFARGSLFIDATITALLQPALEVFARELVTV